MDKINLSVKGAPLIKFQSEERILSLQKGKIYANTLEYYRKREEETNDTEVGDRFEAMLHVNEAKIIVPDAGINEILHDALIPTVHSNDYIFCMFAIYPQLQKFSFTEQQKEKLLSFGNTALVITDYDEFILRVKTAASKQGYEAKFEAVNYYDPNIDSANMILSIMQDMRNIALWKRDSYKYQQEGRFIFSSENMSLDHLELDIGDISDISKVLPSEIVLTAIVEKKN